MLEHHKKHRRRHHHRRDAGDRRGCARLRHPQDRRRAPHHRVLREAARSPTSAGRRARCRPTCSRAGRVYLASMGIYIFEATVLYGAARRAPRTTTTSARQIIPDAIHERNVVAYPFTGYWNDIGTVRSFFETNIMLAQPHPAFNLYDPSYAAVHERADAAAGQDHAARASRTRIIGEGSVIVDSDISNSVIGIRSFIDRGSRAPPHGVHGRGLLSAGRNSEAATARKGPAHPGIGEGTRDRERDRRQERVHRQRVRDHERGTACRKARAPASTFATASSSS